MENSEFAQPLYEQRLEQALKLGPLLDHVETVVNTPLRFVYITICFLIHILPFKSGTDN